MDLNIFELASRQKTRFTTPRGVVSVEALWDMSLTSKSGLDLDSIGQAIIMELEGLKTRSLVNTRPNPRVAELELELALVKHVIDYKVALNAANLAKAKRIEERNKLIELLGKKQDAALESLTEAEIKAKLAALDE